MNDPYSSDLTRRMVTANAGGGFDPLTWDQESYAVGLAPPEHWALADVVAVVDAGAKKVGSAENHRLATTSAYFAPRLEELPARMVLCLALGFFGSLVFLWPGGSFEPGIVLALAAGVAFALFLIATRQAA